MSQSINEKESIEIIHTMIRKSRINLGEGSVFYLIWGWAVLLAILSQYIMLTAYPTVYHWVVWPVGMTIAGVASAVVGRRRSRQRKYVTFVNHHMAYLWGGFVIYLLLVLLMSSQIGWTNAYILIIGLYGLGTFISGGILRFRPLLWGGVASLLLMFIAIIAHEWFRDFTHTLLLLGVSICISYLIPGYMLRAKAHAT